MVSNAAIGALSSGFDTYLQSGGSATASDYAVSIMVGGTVGAIGGLLGGNGTGNNHLSNSFKRVFGVGRESDSGSVAIT